MLIEFTRNGKSKRMNPKLARVLAKKGHVRIADVGVQTEAVEKPTQSVTQSVSIGYIPDGMPTTKEAPLYDMSLEQLRAHAEQLGITVHHRAGAEKIRSDIRAHMA